MFRERGESVHREREREMESVCREREGVSFEVETEGECGEIKRGSVRGKR